MRIRRTLLTISLAAGLATISTEGYSQTQDVDPLVRSARDLAREDANTESADLFGQAIEMDPSRREELLPEYADQLTYSERSSLAVPLYREALAASDSETDRRRLRDRLALALSWSGELGESLDLYREMAEEDPGDADAGLGAARVLSWMGRLGEAREAYEQVLERHPDNLRAQRALAELSQWQNRPRQSIQELEAILASHPDDADSRILYARALASVGRNDLAKQQLNLLGPDDSRAASERERLERREAPRLSTDARYISQSNGTRWEAEVDQTVTFRDGRLAIGPRYGTASYRRPDSDEGRLDYSRRGIMVRNRFNEAVELNARVYSDSVRIPAEDRSHTSATYDTWLTIFPSDPVRIDVSHSRATFDNYRALSGGITAQFVGISTDYAPSEKLALNGRFSYGFFSDTNRRTQAQFQIERRIVHHPRLWVGYRVNVFDFAKQLDSGYFNPDRLQTHSVTTRVWDSLGGNVYYNLDTSYGYEVENHGANKRAWSFAGRLTWVLNTQFEIETGYSYFSSRTASSSGFARETGTIALKFLW